MRISQLTKVIDKDEKIIIEDYDAPIDKMRLYDGEVRGIKRDDPINKMTVVSVCADDDCILALAIGKEDEGK